MSDELDILLDRLSPGVVDRGDWDGVLRRVQATRRRRRPVIALVAGLASAAAAALALLATLGGTGTASAAEVRAKLADALRSTQSLSGEFTVVTRPAARHRRGCFNCLPAVPTPSRFIVGADGSYLAQTLPLDAAKRVDFAYDARTGVATTYQAGYVKGPGLYVRATGNDPVLPGYSPEAQLAAWVRVALARHDPKVADGTFERRPVWRLTLRFVPGDDFYDTYGVRVDVVVDRSTGLVLQVTQYADAPNRWTSIETIQDLEVGAATARPVFTLTVPMGARRVVHDYGFRRVAVSRAAAIVGYRPLLPAGRRPLVDFAVAAVNDQRVVPSLPALRFRDVVSARYGHGFDSVVVSTRRGHPADLLRLFEGVSARTVQLIRGPLAGGAVYLSTSPPDPGYLAGFHDGLVVEVRASSAAESIAVAESLTVR